MWRSKGAVMKRLTIILALVVICVLCIKRSSFLRDEHREIKEKSVEDRMKDYVEWKYDIDFDDVIVMAEVVNPSALFSKTQIRRCYLKDKTDSSYTDFYIQSYEDKEGNEIIEEGYGYFYFLEDYEKYISDYVQEVFGEFKLYVEFGTYLSLSDAVDSSITLDKAMSGCEELSCDVYVFLPTGSYTVEEVESLAGEIGAMWEKEETEWVYFKFCLLNETEGVYEQLTGENKNDLLERQHVLKWVYVSCNYPW